MNEEITATTTFDVPSMLVAFRWHNRINRRRRFLRIGLIFFFVAATIATINWPVHDLPLMLAVVFLCGGLGALIGFQLEKRRFISGLKSSPLLGTSLTYKATEEALLIISSNSNGTLNWDVFHKTVGTPDGVLLYQQKYLFNWLPKTAFASESDYGRFLQLIATRTKHSKIG